MANLYHVSELPAPGPAELTGDLAHHLVRVLRVRPGKEIRLGDGRGNTGSAVVTAAAKGRVKVAVGPHASCRPPCPELTLAFAVPRASRADWLLEHATEVGVQRFVPLMTERSRPQGLRVDRWRKITVAAAGQCDRAWLPEVQEPVGLPRLADRRTASPSPCWPMQPAPPANALGADQHAALLIGPEGGLTSAECAAAREAGFDAIRFAPHILRTETAAMAGAAILLANAQSR